MHRRSNERDALPKSTGEYAQQVEQLLQYRRAALNAEWDELEEGWTAISERMAEVGLSSRNSGEGGVVKLNVGGPNVRVSRYLFAEIEGFEDSVLGALLEGVWAEGRIPRDEEGRIVLDESPTCIKLIMHTMLRATSTGIGRSSLAANGVPASGTSSAVASDEIPCLLYTASVMRLSGYAPTHPNYVKIHGGSAILGSLEQLRFGDSMREWVGRSTDELTLIYRATRDGFSNAAFTARCNQQSSKTVSLIRVSSGEGNDDEDSVVGGYTVHPWSTTGQYLTKDTFVFMLKDGSATRKDVSEPIKWNVHPNFENCQYPTVHQGFGPYFGSGGLAARFHGRFHGTPGRCNVQTGQDSCFMGIDSSPAFLALNGKKVVDIEVYRYSTPAPPPTGTAPSTTKPGGHALTDAEPHDIDLFGRSIASSLMEERVVLDRAVSEMETAGARVSAAVSALETVYGPSVAAGEQDTVVELNVRGTRMTTLRSTLQACPSSALAPMFDEERWPATGKDKDEHGRRLIDCDPTCFSKLLDVLRMRKRASWSAGATGKKREGSWGKCSGAIAVKKADVKAFEKAVNMYFPGCESFIMDLVQKV